MIFGYYCVVDLFLHFWSLNRDPLLVTTIHPHTNPVSIQAFHLFHVSCLIHWILQCELQTSVKPVDEPKMEPKAKRRSKKKTGTKHNAKEKEDETKSARRINSVFCPECQGTGICIEGDELEKPPVSLSEVCKQRASFHSSFSTLPTHHHTQKLKRETKIDVFLALVSVDHPVNMRFFPLDWMDTC